MLNSSSTSQTLLPSVWLPSLHSLQELLWKSYETLLQGTWGQNFFERPASTCQYSAGWTLNTGQGAHPPVTNKRPIGRNFTTRHSSSKTYYAIFTWSKLVVWARTSHQQTLNCKRIFPWLFSIYSISKRLKKHLMRTFLLEVFLKVGVLITITVAIFGFAHIKEQHKRSCRRTVTKTKSHTLNRLNRYYNLINQIGTVNGTKCRHLAELNVICFTYDNSSDLHAFYYNRHAYSQMTVLFILRPLFELHRG